MTQQEIDKIKSKLSELLNVNVKFGISEFQIVDYKYDNGEMIIEVSDRDTPFIYNSVNSCLDFINDLIPIKSLSLNQVTSKIEKRNDIAYDNIATMLKEIILDNITKLKTDSKFIPQANAINSQMQSLINLKKLEIEDKKLKMMLEKKSKGLSFLH